MENKNIIIGILVVIIIVLIIVCSLPFLTQNKQDTIQVDDLNIEKDQWNIYKLVGHITPLKDYDYLGAKITLYDAHGTIIGECPVAWNSNNLKAGQKISVGTSLGATTSGTPAYGIITFYDDIGGKNPVLNFTVNFTNNTTTANTTNEDTAVSSSNTSNASSNNNQNSKATDDNAKKYSNNEMNKAISESYSDGYRDGLEHQSNSYADSSGSGSSGAMSTGQSYSDMVVSNDAP